MDATRHHHRCLNRKSEEGLIEQNLTPHRKSPSFSISSFDLRRTIHILNSEINLHPYLTSALNFWKSLTLLSLAAQRASPLYLAKANLLLKKKRKEKEVVWHPVSFRFKLDIKHVALICFGRKIYRKVSVSWFKKLFFSFFFLEEEGFRRL